MTKRALITGITGQDGSYLADLLLSKNYEVHGLVRRIAVENPDWRFNRINHCKHRIKLHFATLESLPSVWKIVAAVKPDEVYHLAGQSFVVNSFEDEFTTFNVNLTGTHNILTCVRDIVPQARFYFAATSEMYGDQETPLVDENSRMLPRSTYGISKLAAHNLVRHYREAYGLFSASGILFNHESPRRGMEFVTRKITRHVGRVANGVSDKLHLGNLSARRDWGHSRDYVGAMWQMLQGTQPEDYVIATGVSHSVAEFCELAYAQINQDWHNWVIEDEQYKRPSDINYLCGNATKAQRQLGFIPEATFEDLVWEMVDWDCTHTHWDNY